jgi:multidrug efflux pump subunit AcrB
VVQSLDYPTIEVRVNRERAGESDVTAEELGRSLVPSTFSSRFTVPNYWRDPASGVAYQVQVEVPQERMNSAKEVGMITVKRLPNGKTVMVRALADMNEGTMPGEYDRSNMRHVVSLTANVQEKTWGVCRAGSRRQSRRRASRRAE